jgi:UDP-N-acetylmuramyl pentapeptide phosphotransferase/UDP-N-acetylglucosamine-1-phosphate transferase
MKLMSEPWALWAVAGAAVAAAALSAAIIALLRPLLAQIAMARPNARSSHRVPTPQGGGAGVAVATLATTLVLTHALGIAPTPGWPLWSVAVATILIAVIGAIDDIRVIEVVPRLLFQTAAVAAVVAALPADFALLQALPWPVERAILVLAGVWFVNLVNFMDGIDWMTVAEMLPLCAGLAIAGWLAGLPDHATLMAAALFGGIAGFAPFNRPVAKLFLGDVGSLAVGLLTGWLLMLLAGAGHLAAALLLPLYYLADTSITLARRLMHGERFWQAHRTHFYQRATDNGFTVMAIVSRVFMLNVVLVVLAIGTILQPAWSIAALIVGAALVGILLVSFAKPRSRT